MLKVLTAKEWLISHFFIILGLLLISSWLVIKSGWNEPCILVGGLWFLFGGLCFVFTFAFNKIKKR